MHHFLKTFYSYKDGTPSWEVKRTPTLTYWMNKFSSKPLICHVAEAEFDVLIDENDEDTSELKDVVSVHVIPYHLTTNVSSEENTLFYSVFEKQNLICFGR